MTREELIAEINMTKDELEWLKHHLEDCFEKSEYLTDDELFYVESILYQLGSEKIRKHQELSVEELIKWQINRRVKQDIKAHTASGYLQGFRSPWHIEKKLTR